MSGTTMDPSAPKSKLPVDVRVVEAVAEAAGVAAADLDPLNDDVDLEAMAAVVASGEADLQVHFSTNGHRVSVDGTGTVFVE